MGGSLTLQSSRVLEPVSSDLGEEENNCVISLRKKLYDVVACDSHNLQSVTPQRRFYCLLLFKRLSGEPDPKVVCGKIFIM